MQFTDYVCDDVHVLFAFIQGKQLTVTNADAVFPLWTQWVTCLRLWLVGLNLHSVGHCVSDQTNKLCMVFAYITQFRHSVILMYISYYKYMLATCVDMIVGRLESNFGFCAQGIHLFIFCVSKSLGVERWRFILCTSRSAHLSVGVLSYRLVVLPT